MRTLEEIAKNPRAATISENLVLLADPFEDARKQDILTPATIEDITQALREKRVQGEQLVSVFIMDLLKLTRGYTDYKSYSVDDVYQKLELMMQHRPIIFEEELKRLWKQHERIESGKIRLPSEQVDMANVAQYTHQWQHFVVHRRGPKLQRRKKHRRKEQWYDPYKALKSIPENGITLYLPEDPNTAIVYNSLFGWQGKLKGRERIVRKILYKILEELEKTHFKPEEFYASYFGTDYFGCKPIGKNWEFRTILMNFLYSPNSMWTVLGKKEIPGKGEEIGVGKGYIVGEDLSKSKKKHLHAWEYLLSPKSQDTTEMLQLQVTTWPGYLLDEFFEESSHTLYRQRRLREEEELFKRYRRLSDRMSRSMHAVLDVIITK